jgi:hypothetical protein
MKHAIPSPAGQAVPRANEPRKQAIDKGKPRRMNHLWRAREKILIFLLALSSVAINSSAPIVIPPTLKLQLSSTNVVTVTANAGSRQFPDAVLEMSTNPVRTNWINLQTNFYVDAGPIVFENVPATNAIEFFRLYEY